MDGGHFKMGGPLSNAHDLCAICVLWEHAWFRRTLMADGILLIRDQIKCMLLNDIRIHCTDVKVVKAIV